MTRRYLAGLVVVLLVLGLAVLPLAVRERYVLQVAIVFFYFGFLGTAWSVAGGFAGLFSVGHAAFVGIGAYTSTLLFLRGGLSPWVGMLAGAALAAAIAVVIGYPCFRFGLRGDYFALATIAFAEIVYEVINGLPRLTGGPQGVTIPYLGSAPKAMQFLQPAAYYYLAMGLWLFIVMLAWLIHRSRPGLWMMSVRDDEYAAERVGINVQATKLWAFALSAALSALAGTLYAQFYLFFEPATILSVGLSVQIVLMAALGGMALPLGASVGAAILVPAGQVFATAMSSRYGGRYAGLDLVIYGAVLIFLVRYLPKGILGSFVGSRR